MTTKRKRSKFEKQKYQISDFYKNELRNETRLLKRGKVNVRKCNDTKISRKTSTFASFKEVS